MKKPPKLPVIPPLFLNQLLPIVLGLTGRTAGIPYRPGVQIRIERYKGLPPFRRRFVPVLMPADGIGKPRVVPQTFFDFFFAHMAGGIMEMGIKPGGSAKGIGQQKAADIGIILVQFLKMIRMDEHAFLGPEHPHAARGAFDVKGLSLGAGDQHIARIRAWVGFEKGDAVVQRTLLQDMPGFDQKKEHQGRRHPAPA